MVKKKEMETEITNEIRIVKEIDMRKNIIRKISMRTDKDLTLKEITFKVLIYRNGEIEEKYNSL